MESLPVSGSQEWSKSKKIVVFSIVGVIVVLSTLAVAVPSAKEYIITIIKMLMEFVKVFL